MNERCGCTSEGYEQKWKSLLSGTKDEIKGCRQPYEEKTMVKVGQ